MVINATCLKDNTQYFGYSVGYNLQPSRGGRILLWNYYLSVIELQFGECMISIHDIKTPTQRCLRKVATYTATNQTMQSNHNQKSYDFTGISRSIAA